jgi:hypothetical protein
MRDATTDRDSTASDAATANANTSHARGVLYDDDIVVV